MSLFVPISSTEHTCGLCGRQWIGKLGSRPPKQGGVAQIESELMCVQLVKLTSMG